MTFTQWFQSWGGEAFGWFLATTVLILMIALPLMLAISADLRRLRRELTAERVQRQ